MLNIFYMVCLLCVFDSEAVENLLPEGRRSPSTGCIVQYNMATMQEKKYMFHDDAAISLNCQDKSKNCIFTLSPTSISPYINRNPSPVEFFNQEQRTNSFMEPKELRTHRSLSEEKFY